MDQIDKDVENIYFKIPDQAMEYMYRAAATGTQHAA